MLPGSDSMGVPASFTARRPNASHLPSFELPPPQLSNLHQKYHYSHPASSQPPSSLTSVGNLLTPPSALSSDGLSPINSGTATSNQQLPPYTPASGYMWPPPSSTGTNPYGLQSGNSSNSYLAHRNGLFSPSINSLVRGPNSSTASEGLPPPNYGDVPPFQTTMSMSAPSSLPALSTQHSSASSGMMVAPPPLSTPVTHASPVTTQDSYPRLPPTPTFYNAQHPPPNQPSNYSYSSGPSPIQQSPMSAGGQIPRMSPPHGPGSIPPIQHHQQQQQQHHQQQQQHHHLQHQQQQQSSQSPYAHQRPFQYPMPGPVLSNVGNPNSQMALVGGMPGGMMPGFNSGHAAHMQLYGHPQAQPNPQNDRPFKCDQCPQSFNRNHDLKRHKRIHLAVKPFPCGHCDKSFSRKDALKVRTLMFLVPEITTDHDL